MKRNFILLSLTALAVLSACHRDGSDPNRRPTRSEGIEFAPQMYDAYPYEPYKQVDYNAVNAAGGYGGQNVRQPVQNTIARGHANHGLPFGTAPLNAGGGDVWQAGYDAATAALVMPDSIRATDETLAKAKKIYETYCDHCHGGQGTGDGPISRMERIVVPSYKGGALMALSPGQMFYSITYGKNAMGAHASQLSPEERWMLIHYIHKLQGRTVPQGTARPAAADSTRN
jgi:mono/diheme cytochrome c family protein